MFELRLYKYDSTKESNGYRGTGDNDFSRFLAQGSEVNEDITQELDTGELTLYGLTTKDAFTPQTKFILDIVEKTALTENIVQTVHLVVARDIVNQPILSDDTYFDHHISFIEPSVIAQQRVVDNIAVTYKLKDVSLDVKPAYPTEQLSSFNLLSRVFTPSTNFGYYTKDVGLFSHESYYVHGKYFNCDSTASGFLTPTNEKIRNTYIEIEKFKNSAGEYKARFKFPPLKIFYGQQGTVTYSEIGEASIDYTINEYNIGDLSTPTNTWEGSFISNNDLGGDLNSTNIFRSGKMGGEWLVEEYEIYDPVGAAHFVYSYYKKYTNKNASTPTYITPEFDILPDKQYIVRFSLHQFSSDVPTDSAVIFKYSKNQPSYYCQYYVKNNQTGGILDESTTIFPFVDKNTSASIEFYTYSADTSKKVLYASSTPYSALALLQKAIINSGIYEKKANIYIADVNNSDLPFYIDENFIDELSGTKIIENFYTQKNLWEIMLEVGNYIHAIPELQFGDNDRFKITFNRLGRTDEKQNKNTRVSIFNSRSVEDYISATSSYVSNMVQLGGYIEEWVAPKTLSETLIISNDTIAIVTSKPIIELLEIKVKKKGESTAYDLINFVYEENVYKTLSIDYLDDPNRGIALYYRLGENAIIGGNYQLPQPSSNIYSDYSIKKVIYSAINGYVRTTPPPPSGYWDKVQVNDYLFYIKYRTKDDVRQSQARPDLRKYLLNSKWDRIPEHNQFNNQQDVLIDSVKFGNNVFGKLIKTGNNSYEISEWTDEWANVKHKGELYRINDELYYVAKAAHTIYHDHIVSSISYSKDYNELSRVVGIPSESRFYEISEQSLIRRDVSIDEEIMLTDTAFDIKLGVNTLTYGKNTIITYDHLADLIAGTGTSFAKYAVTVFKGDNDADKYDQTVGQKDWFIPIMTPLNAYSSENTLTYEWDMLDNYSAGDQVIDTPKQYYDSLWAVKYTDIFGKAALMDFYIFTEANELTDSQIAALPESPYIVNDRMNSDYVGYNNVVASNIKAFNTNQNISGIGLLKDCREAISINYNLRMITSSDTFVLSPFLFSPNKKNLKIVVLSDEVNKLSNGYISESKIIYPESNLGGQLDAYFPFTLYKHTRNNPPAFPNIYACVDYFAIEFPALYNIADSQFTTAAGNQRIKSIALISTDSDTPYVKPFYIARNIPENWTVEQAIKLWYFGSPVKSYWFNNKQ